MSATVKTVVFKNEKLDKKVHLVGGQKSDISILIYTFVRSVL